MKKYIQKAVDYEIIIQAISSYLLGAMDFIGEYKNIFSIGVIPDGHHIYTGALKAAGYRLLKPSKTLVLIGEGAINDKICVLDANLDLFMGKKILLDKKILNFIKGSKIVNFVQHKFDWIESELPFLRIISDYKNIVFMEIGDNVPKDDAVELLLSLSNNANLMFISDFHRDKPIDLCKKLDDQILNLNFVKKDKDLSLIEIFLRLSKKMKKKPNLLAYLNTGDISMEKNTTNGFGCIFL